MIVLHLREVETAHNRSIRASPTRCGPVRPDVVLAVRPPVYMCFPRLFNSVWCGCAMAVLPLLPPAAARTFISARETFSGAVDWEKSTPRLRQSWPNLSQEPTTTHDLLSSAAGFIIGQCNPGFFCGCDLCFFWFGEFLICSIIFAIKFQDFSRILLSFVFVIF